MSPRHSQGGLGAHRPHPGPVPRGAPARGPGGARQVPGGGARGGAGGEPGRQEGEGAGTAWDGGDLCLFGLFFHHRSVHAVCYVKFTQGRRKTVNHIGSFHVHETNTS